MAVRVAGTVVDEPLEWLKEPLGLVGRVIGALGFTFRDQAIIEIEMIDIPERLRHDVVVSRRSQS